MGEKLYQKIFDDLEGQIVSKQYTVGSTLPSVVSLSKKYDVSEITVKHALNNLKDQGYIIRKPKLGSKVISNEQAIMKALPSNKHDTVYVGVIFPKIDSIFGIDILNGVLDAAPEEFEIIIKKTDGNEATENQVIEDIVATGIQGLILLPSSSEFMPPALLQLIASGFPVVLVDRTFPGIPVNTVTIDNANSAWKATNCLFSNGHKNIGFVTSSYKISTIDERQRGFTQAYATKNIYLNSELICHVTSSDYSNEKDILSKDKAKIKNFIKDHPEITAILATEYHTAELISEVCEDLKIKIPEDISLICYDYPNGKLINQSFVVTHIEQDQRMLGERSVQILHDLIVSPENAALSVQSEVVPNYLVMGNSIRNIEKEKAE